MRALPALAAVLALAATPALAASARGEALRVADPWSRPAVAGFTGVGYMRLENAGPRAATLVKVESPAAARVEIHRTMTAGGVASMAPEPRVEVPAGGAVAFAPGGYHLMFVGLKRGLKPGDRLPATLVFANGRRLPVVFEVGSGSDPMGHSDAPARGAGQKPHFVTKK